MNEKRISLNANQLKIIAIITMTIDHVTSILNPGYPTAWWILLLHMIGRITAPTMWFFIVEGYHHTHNLKKYISRLFVFAIFSHFAYNFAFGIPFIPFQKTILNQTSVIWPLGWGVVALWITHNEKIEPWKKRALIFIICMITLCSDWSCFAVLAILEIDKYRGNFKKQMQGMVLSVSKYALGYFLFADKVYGAMQIFVILSIPFLYFYNGKRGNGNKKVSKWFFYIYYVLHLVILGIIRVWLWGNVGVITGGL